LQALSRVRRRDADGRSRHSPRWNRVRADEHRPHRPMVTLAHDSASSRKQPVAARPAAECTARIEDSVSDRGGERVVESPAPVCVARLRALEARHRFDHARYLLARDPGDAGGGSDADRRAGVRGEPGGSHVERLPMGSRARSCVPPGAGNRAALDLLEAACRASGVRADPSGFRARRSPPQLGRLLTSQPC